MKERRFPPPWSIEERPPRLAGYYGYEPELRIADLAKVERYIRESERHLSRQREIELERHGPRDLLETFETAQSKHFNDRAHLLLALQEIT